MKEHRCSNCSHFLAGPKSNGHEDVRGGECHCLPPQVVLMPVERPAGMQGGKVMMQASLVPVGVFPPTKETNGCGRWQRSEEPAKVLDKEAMR